MRITQKMMTDTMLTDLSNNNFLLSKVQHEISSGTRITNPPIASGNGVRPAVAGHASRRERSTHTNSRNRSPGFSATESALAGLSDSLQRARELAVRGAQWDHGPPRRRPRWGAEVDQIHEHAVEVGNSKFTGQYHVRRPGDRQRALHA